MRLLRRAYPGKCHGVVFLLLAAAGMASSEQKIEFYVSSILFDRFERIMVTWRKVITPVVLTGSAAALTHTRNIAALKWCQAGLVLGSRGPHENPAVLRPFRSFHWWH